MVVVSPVLDEYQMIVLLVGGCASPGAQVSF